MTDVFLERRFDAPLTGDLVRMVANEALACFELHRVDWLGSLLATGGRDMVCRFQAPDAESARTALRQVGADVSVLWPGTVHPAPRPPQPDPRASLVLVTRRFEEPVEMAAIQAIEEAGAWCLETRGVAFVRSFFALDRQRMLCLYQAPDANAVRQAQQQAGMPVESVWPVHFVDGSSSPP